ncbi:MAG: hypothetical protein HC873_12355 [Leptolyngbyaceae cyanobacterium SL_1_1]|nr:hypothetical protein [Leptolyngbyaceae cyanobacterium SL_1_1]
MSPGTFFLQTLCRTGTPISPRHRAAQAIANHAAALQPPSQQLLKVVQELRSPQSGWPVHLPQTPENIAPYVCEEIQEMVEVLQAVPLRIKELPQLWLLHYSLIESLVADMLWSIARSDYETLRLLEGVKALLQPAIAPPRPGILRLVAVLCLQTDQRRQLLDLATRASPDPEHWLIEPVSLQIDDGDLCQRSLQSAQLLTQLNQRIQRLTPSLGPLLEGLDVELLQPLQPWQRGQLQFILQLEFVPQSADVPLPLPVAAAFSPRLDLFQPASKQNLVPASSESVWITLAEPAWVQQFSQHVAQQSLVAILPEAAQVEGLAPVAETQTAFTHWLIAETSAIVEGLQDNRQLFQPAFFRQPILLCDLLPRLLWSVSRSTHAAMQLIGGITARQLQPEGVWQTGCLQLKVNLHIQMAQASWQFDVSTGLSVDNSAPRFLESAIQLARG